jgi:hypothetical protein
MSVHSPTMRCQFHLDQTITRSGLARLGAETGTSALRRVPELGVLELDHTCINDPSRNTDDLRMVWLEGLGESVFADIFPNVDRVLVWPGGELGKVLVRVIVVYFFGRREEVETIPQ